MTDKEPIKLKLSTVILLFIILVVLRKIHKLYKTENL